MKKALPIIALLKKKADAPIIFILICFVLLIIQGAAFKLESQVWTEDSFEDFIDGKLDASGNNIYVSKDGKIRTIHHFDYNSDGYIDLLFPHTHDSYSDIPATLGSVQPNRSIIESNLAVRGSLQVSNYDLNHDGFQDLIFCPNYNGSQNFRNFVTIIYGGEDGWPSYRSRAALPVFNMKSVAIADLNKDGWADIVTLNGQAWKPGQPSGNIIRIFWGGERGFLNTWYHDLGVYGAIGLASGDFDNDSFPDLAILRDSNDIKILWATQTSKENVSFDTTSIKLQGGKAISITAGDCDNDNVVDLLAGTKEEVLYIVPSLKNRSFGNPLQIASFNSSNIVVGDIDKDGLNDILMSYLSVGYASGGELMGAKAGSGNSANILWGDRNGFSNLRTSRLDAPKISASAIGDFDGDGKNDIAIAINKGSEFFTCQSIIYYGKGVRQFEKGSTGITTSGASHVISVSESPGKRDKVIFCNSTGGTVDEKVPAYLYWGAKEGFSESNRTEIPFRAGYECSAADLNADGYVDIVILDEMHATQSFEEDPLAGANIFWGRPEGMDFSIKGRTILTEAFLGSSNIADLNKDGYLDLVLGQYSGINGSQSNIMIYYGTPEGYLQDSKVLIPCSGRSLTIQLADYDKDGWLDIAVNSYREVGVRIFYGSPKGFNYNNRKELDAPAVGDLETADLNSDGWLDIIATCYSDIANNAEKDLGIFIFWGGKEGFIYSNAQWLPAYCVHSPTVADFDNDGYLDIFCPSYLNESTREMQPCNLYWGSKDGFNSRNKTALINDSGMNALAADFDKDGKLDLAVTNHTKDGDHNTYSKVFYNDGNRFDNPRVVKLPTRGPHWSHNEDMGHIYNRSWRQSYESSIINWNKDRTKGKLSFVADIPEGTQLTFEIRTATEKKVLGEENWTLLDDSGMFGLNSTKRFLQYRAVLISDNGDRFPVIDKVVIELNK
jgi:hypothetical protein